MRDEVRLETVNILQTGLYRLAECRQALEAKEFVATMRALTQARETNARAIATMLSACLQDALEDAKKQSAGRDQVVDRIHNLFRLFNFVLSGLCSLCRRKLKIGGRNQSGDLF